MAELFLYPRLTSDLMESSGCECEPYSFYYSLQGGGDWGELSYDKRKSRTKLSEKQNIWRPIEDNLLIEKTVTISYPYLLHGPEGVAPKGAELGVCILWKSSRLNLRGIIYPERVSKRRERFDFSHEFCPGEISGDLSLDLVLYIKSPAHEVGFDEGHLANESGMILGSLEKPATFLLDSDYMDFPIQEVSDPNGPLWRMEFMEWQDPREDSFAESSFALLLNVAHPGYALVFNKEGAPSAVLSEVLSSAYYLIFDKVRSFPDQSAWKDTMDGAHLKEGSISSVLHWFANSGSFVFDWNTPERTMYDIKRIVDMLIGGADE